ncbi:MAG: branched-chain amino acid transport system ATP-binding protein [Candidatus Eremiobacteraeota bacterium]|nr:branched-chain amino acid transport system ATP-binding protein [Candidatus Eremiobacteraeota bacterium]MEA2720063.1 branched-chain amino acid transport system ATP-binding protein [Candidatus Eremiobacteraeota bacterium]
MLELHDVHAYYGESHILHGMRLRVESGEVATLVGRNGVGKTTTLRTIMGIVAARRGHISLNGKPITGLPSDRIAKRGLGYVPEERGILSTLSVYENLTLAPVLGDKGWSVERVFAEFPILKERAKAGGTTLSGGEQQMLAIARVLRSGARTVLLDEPTEGLAPVIVERIGELIRKMKADGITVLLVEQNVRFATGVADRHHVVVHGRVVETLENAEVIAREKELLDLLGV